MKDSFNGPIAQPGGALLLYGYVPDNVTRSQAEVLGSNLHTQICGDCPGGAIFYFKC